MRVRMMIKYMFRLSRDTWSLSAPTGGGGAISHPVWLQLPVFVRRPLKPFGCCGSQPRALGLWPSAQRCCWSAAPQSSAPPASTTPLTSGPRSRPPVATGACSLAPVASHSARCRNRRPGASEARSPPQMPHRLGPGGAWGADLVASAGASSSLGGFETTPTKKRKIIKLKLPPRTTISTLK